ncbi:unnamed protein product, partial [Mesorhabditis spiculigera]
MADSDPTFSTISLGFQLANCAANATANMVVAAVIIFGKELRREKTLTLLSFYCFSDGLYAYGAFYLALRCFQATLWPDVFTMVPVQNCLLNPLHLFIVYAYTAVPLAELALTVDRAIAIFFPTKYLRLDARASLWTISGIVAFSFILVAYCIVDSWRDPGLMVHFGCYPEVYSSLFNELMFGGKATLYCICCLAYLPIIIRLMWLSGTHKKCTCRNCQLKKSCVYMGFLILGLLVLVIIPTPLLLIFKHSQAVELLFYNMALSKPWLNVIFALISFRQLRNVFSQSLGKLKNKGPLVSRVGPPRMENIGGDDEPKSTRQQSV